jgi:SAM-dependent methyltransferase
MKTAMSAQPIGLGRRLAASVELFQQYVSGVSGKASDAVALHRELAAVLAPVCDVRKARILEAGCGQMASQTAMFAADGATVTGIDIEIPTYHMGFRTLCDVMRYNGFERAVKSAIRHGFFDGSYRSALNAEYGAPISHDRLDVRRMSVTHLTFEAATFDFVFSSAVFEHVDDVAAGLREVNRVLKPDGVARIYVDLFPSLGGGHHPEWAEPDTSRPRRVPPWDHLRDNRYPANSFLNRLRLGDYRRLFQEHLKANREHSYEQGAEHLTPELFAELSGKGYTREDLLTRSVVFTGGKKT